VTYALSQFRVWVQPAYVAGSAFYYPWNLSAFVHEPRMIPERVSTRAGGMGSASFRYLRAWREEGAGTFYDGGWGNVGCYVAVTAGVTAFDRAAVIFWGFISQRAIVEISGGNDKAGTITAQGLGYLLDGTQIGGFRAGPSGGVSGAISSPPTFNLQGDGGSIVGNKVTDSNGVAVFANLLSECSSAALFSRNDCLVHVLRYCRPNGMPTLTATGSAAVQAYLADTTSKEVFDLSNVTMRGAIDMLVSRVHGFGWNVVPNASNGWDIVVYPLLDDGSAYGTGYPTATPVNVDLTSAAVESFTYTESADDLWDAVTVQGDNILAGVTLSYADGNLVKGWSSSQETAYRAAAVGDATYPSLTPDEKIARNEQLRNAAHLADVFQLHTINAATAAPLRSANPGTGSATLALVPEISWNGTTASVGAANRSPYLPAARFSRNVPWLSGVSGDGTDSRTTEAKARPAYLTPLVFKYDTGVSGGENVCMDLLTPIYKRASASVAPDERTPGLRVMFNPPETCARGSWSDASDGQGRIEKVETDSLKRTFNYTKMAVTVGIPSDQRVSVTKYRYGVPVGSERRVMVITDDSLQFWFTVAGTIVGAKADGSADRVTVSTFVRNDFPTAERLATMYAAFMFRRRTSINVTLAQPDYLPAWAAIGTMIGQVTEASATGPYPAIVVDSYTTVESVDYSLGEQPRVTVQTTLPATPAMSGGGSSPASGGSVSQTLGGTVAQALNSTQARVEKVAQQTAKAPTTVGRSADSAASGDSLRMTITQANSFTAGQVVYNNAGTWALARADAENTARYSGVVESATSSSFVVVLAGRITLAAAVGFTYYLSDAVAGALVGAGALTTGSMTIPVVRSISASECLVLPARDDGSDLLSLVAGTPGAGGGDLSVNLTSVKDLTVDSTDGVKFTFGSGQYFQVTAAGALDFYHSATARVQIDSAGKVTITYPSSNTVTIDPSHFVGTSRDVRLREIDVCDAGVAKKMLMLASAAY